NAEARRGEVIEKGHGRLGGLDLGRLTRSSGETSERVGLLLPSFRLPNSSKLGHRFRFFFPFRSTFAYIKARRAGGRPRPGTPAASARPCPRCQRVQTGSRLRPRCPPAAPPASLGAG